MAMLEPVRRPAAIVAHRRWPSPALIAQGLAVTLFFSLAALRFTIAPLDRYDEGVTLTKAALTAAGSIPFRDYWITYGPLDTYALAAAFKAFGINLVIERALGVVVLGLLFLVTYAVTGRLGLRGGMRLLLTGLISVVPISVPAFNSAFLANLVGVSAVLAFLCGIDDDRARWPLLAGALVGLASFSRPEFALALGIGLGAGYLVMGLTIMSVRDRLMPYVLGAVSVAAGLWGGTVLMAGIRPVWFDLVTYATSLYPRARGIPFGQGDEAPIVIVLGVVFSLIWVWATIRAYRQRAVAGERARLAALLVGGMLIFTWVRTRADGIHAMDAWPLTAILLALLLERRGRQVRPATGALPALVPIAGILLLSLGAGGLAYRDLARPHAAAGIPHSGISGQRAWMPTPELAGVIREIDAVTPPDRPIWVGLQRNDLVTFNDTMLYFLSGRKPGTVYYETLPGLTNSEPVERAIACQLARAGVELAVLGPNGAGEPWNLSSVNGSPYLDQWLAARTTARSQLGPYLLLRLTPGLRPSDRCP
ncbi:MAG: hypothetical protein E6I74_05650 [Chloroflexi bacterium]|nr:MAG: hypothetical protein E6I74_05650 [Chloroflexota bacterium]